MIVVSDTNILSSLAAGDAFSQLWSLFASAKLVIPPFVEQELQAGLDKGRDYLQPILLAIQNKQLEVVFLLLWVRNVMSQDEVREAIEKMKRVEGLALTPDHLADIFAPPETR